MKLIKKAVPEPAVNRLSIIKFLNFFVKVNLQYKLSPKAENEPRYIIKLVKILLRGGKSGFVL